MKIKLKSLSADLQKRILAESDTKAKSEYLKAREDLLSLLDLISKGVAKEFPTSTSVTWADVDGLKSIKSALLDLNVIDWIGLDHLRKSR